MQLIHAGPEWAPKCVSLFEHCSIRDRYFQDVSRLERSLTRAAERGELYVALNGDDQPAGAMCVVPGGFCGLYPYLNLIGVGEAFRNQGVGAFLMAELEKMARSSGSRRVALLVSDFNTDAQRFYHRLGYWTLGTIPEAARDGIAELVLLKDL